ncbi:hypothetical protein IAW_05012 [Bacillus cereus str. Schrouff]|uniref:DUF4435 domain-containing protein n=1 Tax=Bacillus cereus TaxID=1396 RepID=UPI00032D812D|nr:DUF4435 domain-containing protein [Bacillus cereus]EOO05703.1 hypothetical protein IAW_05012 [Bacillus cereus str. Schrouff]EOO81845.1 hypothetical protein IGY_05556 [Bacillus cereus K-5975c]MCU4896389.1 DUF4435 domain-containing protein [Bacillus cereus]
MNEAIPQLTIEDKKSAAIFEGNAIPCLIVEGTTDVLLYEKLLVDMEITGDFDIVNGESKTNIKKFIEEEGEDVSFLYLVILDSDYERYLNCCLNRENVIYTHFYTMENYITSHVVIQEVINHFSTLRTGRIDATQLMADIVDSIKPYILACLAKLNKDWNVKLEDVGLEKWDYRTDLQVNATKLLHYLESNLSIDLTQELESYEEELDTIIQTGKLELVVSGKRLYDALYWRLVQLFPQFMSGRSKKSFERELYCYMQYDSNAQELRGQIERYFQQNSPNNSISV